MLRGSEDLKKVLRRVIGDEHHVTTDGTFSWIEVECLGACVNAPMAQINADYYEDLTPETLTRILNDMAAGKKPKPGPQVERAFSAPVGGPLTLTDPSLYPEGSRASPARAALHDEDAKKPGEAANLHEAAVPKPPATDATDPRRH